MDRYFGFFYVAIGVAWLLKGVMNLSGKAVFEEGNKNLKGERLKQYLQKTGISCVVFSLPFFGLGLIRLHVLPMSMPAIGVIVVLIGLGVFLSVQAAKMGEG